MTRGTLFYYESDENVWSSTEFNGDMYHGNHKNPQGNGDKVIKLMSNLNSVDDFKRILKEINKNYGYEEGNDCWSVSDESIAEHNKQAIEWIDNERPDLKGDKIFDPRAMEKPLTFKDIRTWNYIGLPSLSDYSYIYNNSGKDLAIKTKSKPMKMVIPNGCCGVLYYGSKDCLCKDGMIIDGMGNYEKDINETDLGCFTVEVTLREDGKYDAFIAHEGSYGSKYQGITVDEIGRMVADDIESVAKCS